MIERNDLSRRHALAVVSLGSATTLAGCGGSGGPAKRPLPAYEARVEPSGDIFVDQDKSADAAFRTKA